MNRLSGLVERATTIVALLAGYALLALALLMTFEIVARKLFAYSVQGIDELGGYALAISAGLGFGYAAFGRAHTRVDLLLRFLPLPLRAGLHILAYALLLAMACFLAWYGWRSLSDTLLFGSVANSPLQTPLWIPETVFLAGLASFVLASLLILVRNGRLFLAGDYRGVDRALGSLSIAEEIEDSGALQALDQPAGGLAR